MFGSLAAPQRPLPTKKRRRRQRQVVRGVTSARYHARLTCADSGTTALCAQHLDCTAQILSLESGRDRPSLQDLFEVFREERDALAPTYEAAMQSGTLTRRAALRAHTHEIWERIAPKLGLRYDRME